MTYSGKILNAISSSKSVLCAGIDPVPEQFPQVVQDQTSSESDMVVTFCRTVIEQTKTRVAAYKINIAYFEALGRDGFYVLNDVLDIIPPGKVIIADAKRGDVPHTNQRYKVAYFDKFGFDAITLSPFMGMDTLEPFLQDERFGVYALTLTSNPGASDLMTRPFMDSSTLSQHIAKRLRELSVSHPGSIGMVIGATQSAFYEPVLRAFPESPLLIPGIGAQGGSIKELSDTLADHHAPALINASRGLTGFDSASMEAWDIQIAKNTDTIAQSLASITEQYL